MINIISPLLSQNQLYTLNRTTTFSSLGRLYVMKHKLLEHVRYRSAFYSNRKAYGNFNNPDVTLRFSIIVNYYSIPSLNGR